jgi:hypothetical protein
MSFLDCFEEEMNRTISVYPKEQTFDAEQRLVEGFASTPTLSGVRVAIWQNSANELLDSDRYKVRVDAVAVAYPGITVPNGAKIIDDIGREYYAVSGTNIMTLDDVYEIGLQNAT